MIFAILFAGLIQAEPQEPAIVNFYELDVRAEASGDDFSALSRIRVMDSQVSERLDQILLKDGLGAFESHSEFRQTYQTEIPKLIKRVGLGLFCDESELRQRVFTDRDCELILGHSPENPNVCFAWARNNLLASSKTVVGRYYTSARQAYWQLEGCSR